MKIFVTYAIVLIEFLISGYVAFLGYVLSSWFINDSVAAKLADSDWNSIAMTRVMYAFVIAFFVTITVYVLNRFIFSRYAKIEKSKQPLIFSIMIFLMIIIPAIMGAVEFVANKPFM